MNEKIELDSSQRQVLMNDVRHVVLNHSHMQTSAYLINIMVNDICAMMEKQYIAVLKRDSEIREVLNAPKTS
jgi:hypothetical protein